MSKKRGREESDSEVKSIQDANAPNVHDFSGKRFVRGGLIEIEREDPETKQTKQWRTGTVTNIEYSDKQRRFAKRVQVFSPDCVPRAVWIDTDNLEQLQTLATYGVHTRTTESSVLGHVLRATSAPPQSVSSSSSSK